MFRVSPRNRAKLPGYAPQTPEHVIILGAGPAGVPRLSPSPLSAILHTMAPHPRAGTRGQAPSTTTALLFAFVFGLLLFALS